VVPVVIGDVQLAGAAGLAVGTAVYLPQRLVQLRKRDITLKFTFYAMAGLDLATLSDTIPRSG
jgi:hypothetical protein